MRLAEAQAVRARAADQGPAAARPEVNRHVQGVDPRVMVSSSGAAVSQAEALRHDRHEPPACESSPNAGTPRQPAVHRDDVAGRAPAPAAGQPQDGLRAQLRRDGLAQQRPARVEPGQPVAQFVVVSCSLHAMPYFVSDDTTRSRGTWWTRRQPWPARSRSRAPGARSRTASSRTRWLRALLLTSYASLPRFGTTALAELVSTIDAGCPAPRTPPPLRRPAGSWPSHSATGSRPTARSAMRPAGRAPGRRPPC